MSEGFIDTGTHEQINKPDNFQERLKPYESCDRSKDVCRDFLNNICNRGDKCCFYHPPDVEKPPSDSYNFCIDFQNRGCFRSNCRFIHADSNDVERYKKTGEVTITLARAIVALNQTDIVNNIPVCKEFQNGTCQRGDNRCRFWHINIAEEYRNRYGEYENTKNAHAGRRPPKGIPANTIPPYSNNRRRGPPPPIIHQHEYDDYYPAPPKRPHMGYPTTPAVPLPDHYVTQLERQNSELTTEVNALRRELQREKERYDDLLMLLRPPQPTGPISQPIAHPHMSQWPPKADSSDKYSWG